MTAKPTSDISLDSYFAGAYWGPRKESPEECAQRTATFLNHLASCDPSLAHWYKLARSRKDSRKAPLMPPDVSTLSELFRRGVNREKGGPVFEDLGFRVWMSNGGAAYEDADLRIKCGGYSGTSPNSCFLSLPTRGPHAERMFTASVLEDVVRGMATAWAPDWVAAMSRTHRELDDQEGPSDISLGWVTYFARHRGTVPPLPTPVRIEHVGNQGTLIILTPERFAVDNTQHVALARRVRELLVKAGLMQPIAR